MECDHAIHCDRPGPNCDGYLLRGNDVEFLMVVYARYTHLAPHFSGAIHCMRRHGVSWPEVQQMSSSQLCSLGIEQESMKIVREVLRFR
jgi:hypothetical protein